MSEWIGVDLDGTLAEYRGPNAGMVGKPIPAMVKRVRRWLAKGIEVRIFTARVSSKVDAKMRSFQVFMVQRFCEEHFGRQLRVTAEKDYEMLEMWDDRAVAVESNTGRIRSHLWAILRRR